MADLEDRGPSRVARAKASPARVRVRLSFSDMLLLLWRAKWIMLAIGAPLLLVGLLIAAQSPETYQATSKLFVRGGDEVRVESALRRELEILSSPVVAERTLARFPLKRIYPRLAEAHETAFAAGEPVDTEAIEAQYIYQSVEAFQQYFNAEIAPERGILSISFRHETADTAAEVLNAAIATYLTYRGELYSYGQVDTLTEQRKAAEAALLEAEEIIRSFLQEHDIGHFSDEREAAQGLFSALTAELLAVRARANATERQLAAALKKLSETDPEISVPVKNIGQQALFDLQVEREQLLARYTESSQAVQNIDLQIAQMEAYLEDPSGVSELTRDESNPDYQALQVFSDRLQSEAQSLAGQSVELEAQLTQIEARRALFAALEPKWNEIVRTRDAQEQNVLKLAKQEQQSRPISGLIREGRESVRVIEEARVPQKSVSMRLPITAFTIFFATVTALIGGLLYVFTRRGFPTSGALEKSTGLNVIGRLGRQ
ncbi:MAG: hypothetical protein Hens3KO_16890 [Henriciella sp.]